MKTNFKTLGLAVAVLAALAVAVSPAAAAAVQAVVAFVGPENLAALALVGSTATTVVQGDTYTGRKPVRSQPIAGETAVISLPIKFPTAAPVANDIHLLCKLIPGLQVVDWTLTLDDLDSDGSPAASLSLGEANATLADITVVYKSGITLGQTGGLLRNVAATAATNVSNIGLATKDTERVIGLKWDTAAATYVADKTGLLTLYVTG